MDRNKAPSGEKILATLIELYADQCGVKVKYRISGEQTVRETGKREQRKVAAVSG